MNYGPTAQLIRGHSELLRVDLSSRNGQALPNALGVEYPFGITRYADRELMEIRGVAFEDFKAKGNPTFAQLPRFLLKLQTPDGDAFVKDLPLSRISWPIGALPIRPRVRNLVWKPRRIDGMQCTIYTVGAAFDGNVVLELVYRT